MPAMCAGWSPPRTFAGSISLSARRQTCMTSSTRRPICSSPATSASRMRDLRSIGPSGRRKRRRRSTTVTSLPRTLTTPMHGPRRARHRGDGRRAEDLGDVGDRHGVGLAREGEGEVLGAPPALVRAPYGALRAPRSSQPGHQLRLSRAAPRIRRRSRAAHEALSLGEHLLDERRHVEHQRHPLVAELRRAGEAAHRLERLAERLDDDVLLPDELVDHEAQPSIAHLSDDHEGRAPAARVDAASPKSCARRQIGSDAPRTVSTSRPSIVRTDALVEARWPPRRWRAAWRRAARRSRRGAR